ncbi:MAG TPA: ATP-binding protein [Pseudomonadales bacterium]|nr:PAS domain S-box protein [Cellvibrionales bacterium]HRF87266.1 ATP-binding protein [Pseudomonadales bacterium]HRG50372.1 ATP-binding protein [Pseudomonadales bacterium]
MSSVAIMVLGVTIFVLFMSVTEQNKRIMISYAEHQASMLQSVMALVPEQTRLNAEPPSLVLEHIRQTLARNPVITDSGEMLFAYREGNAIHFVSPFRFDTQAAQVMADDDARVQAMRLALDGHAGVIFTKDYRSVDVLAAFVPVENMNLGVVVKIDAAEVRQPFIYIALYASLATLCIIVVGSLLLNKITKPLLDTLEENESKYRSLFDNANEGLMVISDRIEECNDQVVRLLGYDKSEIIGRRIADFAPRHREDEGELVDVTRNRFELAAQGKPQYFIWRSLRKDDTEIDLDVMLKMVRIGSRKVILTTLLDITDRRLAEIELRRKEKEVADAREHLAHMARLSTMGEMAAGIAHEINQPLTAISAYAQGSVRLLENGQADVQTLREPLEKIATQAVRAGEVIRRLRSFINKSASELELINANELVSEVVQLAEVDAHRHGIPVYLHLAEQVPAVRVDTVQIQQVILNLIRNALEAMDETPRERARVDVYTQRESDGKVSVRVVDTGSGLSEDALKQVFAPFFTTKAAGMGMGLSISETIVTAHGGHLSVSNNANGMGATFTLLLTAQNA